MEKLPEHRVIGLRLFLMTNKEKKDLKVKELTNPTAFDNLQNPTKGGVYDPELGCYKVGDCETCGLPFKSNSCHKYEQCPGHFGAIRLPLPVYNPYTYEFFLKLLKCICLECKTFGKKESECQLFIKQLEAIRLSQFDLVDKMSDIHSIFEQEYKDNLQGIKLYDFVDQLNKCIQNAVGAHNVNDPRSSTKNILSIEQELCKAFIERPKKCTRCKVPMHAVKSDKQTATIHIEGRGDRFRERPIFTAFEACGILRQVWSNNADILKHLCSTFGVESSDLKADLNGGEKECPTDIFFTSYILVTPPRSRPPNVMAGMLIEHHMSTHYNSIIKAANDLMILMRGQRENESNVTKPQVFDALQNLQMRVNVQVDRSMCKMLKDAPEGIKQILERKTGLMRWNIMGKRVDYAARSVISPDPNIPCDKVGVPFEIAKRLYITEPVTPRNIEEMRKAVINGNDVYPGATMVTLENGKLVSLFAKNEKQREALANRLLTPSTFESNIISKFKTVKRHMKDGDMMLLNRQPTLHKPSIQAFKAMVMKGSRTLKINYSACKAFNADFDGDEMNAHLPQDLISKSEAINIASATEQFLVPKDGKPIGGLIQDHIIGGMMMTMKGVFFTRDKYQEIVYAALCPFEESIQLLPPSMVTPYRLWSGKEVVSTILLNLIPSGKTLITMEANTKISDMDWRSNQKAKPTRFSHLAEMATKTKVMFYNGIMYSGLLDKNQIGASANGLLHYCYVLYGGKMVSNLMSCFARLFTNFLQYQAAFSMGMDDVEFTKKGAKSRRKCIKKILKVGSGVMAKALNHDVNDEEGLRNIYRRAIFNSDRTDIRVIDASFQNIMNEYQEEIKKSCWPHQLIRTFPHNGLLAAVISGAKGSSVNCLQISCLLGQVDLEGSRPAAMVSGKTFALFKPFDLSPQAGGFVFGSFCSGLKQSEFFFHCMAGRDGLIDTAVKTARSGYLQRCLVKLLEGVKIGYDGSVRDHDGSIIQTRYGGDGLDMMKTSLLNKKHFTHLLVNREAILSQEEMADISKKINKSNAESLYKEAEEWKERNADGRQKSLYDLFVDKYMDEAWNQVEHLDIPAWKKKALCSKHLSDTFESLSEKKRARLERKLDPQPNPIISTMNPAMYLGCTSEDFRDEVQSYLKGEFTKSHLIKYGKKRISEEEARDFLNVLYQQALINPGEPVGVLAATSIGEQTTQMTLNTFHFAGSNAMNVTLGVPRLREILMTASRNIKTPQITVPLKRIDSELEAEVEKIICKFRKIPLDKVLKEVQIKETLCRRDDGLHLKFKAKFQLCEPKFYEDEYSITPREVLGYMESTFFKTFVDRTCVKVNKKNEKAVIRKKSNNDRRSEPKFGEDGEEEEKEEKEVKDDDLSDFSDEDNDDEQGDYAEKMKEEENEFEENSDRDDDDDDEKKKVSKDDDNSDDDNMPGGDGGDDDDDDEGGDKMLRKRKMKSKDGRIVFVEEEEKTSSAKRMKIEFDPRVEELKKKVKSITKYEYDAVDNMWCIMEFEIMGKQVTHDFLKREIERSFICLVPDFTNCIMKSIDKDDSPMYMFESAEKMRVESGLGLESRRKKIVIEGKNIMELLKYEDLLSLDEMYCNDIHMVAETFSINVAKKIIIEEIRQVFKAYNIDLDFRHLNLIADFMSFQGVVMPFNRYGINSSTSVIQKASFETAFNFIKTCALNGSYDDLECPSSSIAVGKLISTGTGSFELRTPLC